jgi:hypothetical protein
MLICRLSLRSSKNLPFECRVSRVSKCKPENSLSRSQVLTPAKDSLNLTVPVYPIQPPVRVSYMQNLDFNFTLNDTGSLIWTMNNRTFQGNYNDPLLLLAAQGNTSLAIPAVNVLFSPFSLYFRLMLFPGFQFLQYSTFHSSSQPLGHPNQRLQSDALYSSFPLSRPQHVYPICRPRKMGRFI